MKSFLLLVFIFSYSLLEAQTTSKKAEKYFLEGKNFEMQRNYEEAIESYRKAILADADYAEAHFELAKIYLLYR
ncbi:MAG: tetratricopeptide repeat protein, partial [Flammeovirgaceae bacterium]|nr:tetratricopeptide repeat protein [Flammeovirgaceae bacterium]MDW8288730.1 tetratricopeptide repeat protein [Flammeovirgaceae bacterium]